MEFWAVMESISNWLDKFGAYIGAGACLVVGILMITVFRKKFF